MSFSESLREYVKSRIDNQDISLSELYRRSGVPVGSLSRYVNGRRGLSESSIDAVLEVLYEDAHDAETLLGEAVYVIPAVGRSCSRPAVRGTQEAGQ